MIYVGLFFLSFLLTYLIKNYAIKRSLVAEVNERSSHTTPTPHGGGIAIAITWFVGLFYLFISHKIEPSLFYALLFGAVIAVVSLLDDVYELSPKIRIVTQIAVGVGGLLALGGLHKIDFGIFTISNPWFTTLFALLLVVWYINLFNFLDGINGYAGAEALFLAGGGLLLFGGTHFVVLGVAVLGFLFWNWNKAKIFMGDVGSTLLGYNIAIFTIYYADVESRNLWVWIILFGVFWFDATLTLIRRKLNGEQLSVAHKKHAYQRLTQMGWSHQKVSTYAIFLNLSLFAILFFVSNIFLAFLLMLALLFWVMNFINKGSC